MASYGIENRQELAHAGGQGQFLRLARAAQALVERANDGIEARGDQGPPIHTRRRAGGPDHPRTCVSPVGGRYRD